MSCNRLRKISEEIDTLFDASTNGTITIAGNTYRYTELRWYCCRTGQSFSQRALALYIANQRALRTKAARPARLTRADISERLLKNVEYSAESGEVRTNCGGLTFVRPVGSANWRCKNGLCYSPKQLVDTLYRRLNGHLTRYT